MAEGAGVKEMECAAVAWVCEKLRVPFVALKSITDIVDGDKATRDEFESNLRTASAALQVTNVSACHGTGVISTKAAPSAVLYCELALSLHSAGAVCHGDRVARWAPPRGLGQSRSRRHSSQQSRG